MKGTIKRVGKIFRDRHGTLQTEGWDITSDSVFTLQDLITIAGVYPYGGGPYNFGSALNDKPKEKHQKPENRPQFKKRKKKYRR
jgi:hypothetical protein